MALPIRALAMALMPQYAKAGMSAGAVTRALKKRFGAAYRRTTLLSDYAGIKGMVKNEFGVRNLKLGTNIPKQLMTEMKLGLERKYRIIANAFFLNPETGEEIERPISWYTNMSGSKDVFVGEYKEKVERLTEQPESLPYRIEIYVVQHYVGRPY